MRKLLILGLLAALVGSLAVAGPAASKRKSIEVDDDYFVAEGKPRTVTVSVDDTVVWKWEGSNPHDVTVTRGPVKFHSRTKTSGTYRKKVTRAGTYRIVCTVHRPDMRMRLKVVD
jgi:plastocyanin